MGSARGRFWVQTNNQQLEQSFGGTSFLTATYLKPVCIRIARHLCDLLASRMPRLDFTNVIERDPRAYSNLADHAANVALDRQLAGHGALRMTSLRLQRRGQISFSRWIAGGEATAPHLGAL